MGSGNNKTVAVALAGSLCVLLAWVLRTKFGVDTPGEVQAAFQNIFAIVCVWLVPHSNNNGSVN